MKHRLLLLLFIAFCSTPAFAETGDSCRAELGRSFNFNSCTVMQVDSLRIRSMGVSRPNPAFAMSCWKYLVSAANSDTPPLEIQHCHTGELGGTKEFTVGGTSYVLDFDVTSSCVPFRYADGVIVWRKDKLPGDYESRLKRYEHADQECRIRSGLVE